MNDIIQAKAENDVLKDFINSLEADIATAKLNNDTLKQYLATDEDHEANMLAIDAVASQGITQMVPIQPMTSKNDLLPHSRQELIQGFQQKYKQQNSSTNHKS